MTKTPVFAVFTALFFSVAAANATETGLAGPAQTSTAAPAAIQPPPRYAPEIMRALKHLSALLSKNSRVDQKELDGVAGEIVRLDARVKKLLGPILLKEIEDQEKDQEYKARITGAKEELAGARAAILLYYGDSEGIYPANPADLIPKYMPAAPELELPGHIKTSAIELTDAECPDIEKAITDTGGWLYFTNPKSRCFGMLVLNCSHQDENGTELYKY
jgi:hypothetical protein